LTVGVGPSIPKNGPQLNAVRLLLGHLEPPDRGEILHQVREELAGDLAAVRRPQHVQLAADHLPQQRQTAAAGALGPAGDRADAGVNGRSLCSASERAKAYRAPV